MSNAAKDRFTGKIFRCLWWPAIVSSVGLAFGDMADAVVVGQKMGATGLAAISLCLPLYMVINVCMHGLGLGGSVRYSRCLGEGKKEEAVANFNRILQAAVAVSVILAVLGNLMLAQVLALLGTVPEDGALYLASRDYARIIIAGMPAFFLSYIINNYLRNDDDQKLASFGFTAANILDILLNVLFVLVLQMGAAGAALSTVIGQVIAIIIYLPGILGKKHILKLGWYRPDIAEVWGSFKTGFSTSVQYICQMVFLLIINNVLLRYSGEEGVAVFDMVQNASYLILYLYDGTAKAMQPLISTYCGERNEEGKRRTLKLGIISGMVAGGSAIALVYAFPGFLCRFFGLGEGGIMAMGSNALRIFCIGAFFGGISVLLEGYHQSCEKEKNAFMLATLRGTIVLIPCTVLFAVLGMDVFWWLFPVTEILSLAFFFVWKRFWGEPENSYDLARVYGRTIENSNEDLEVLTAEVEEFCERWNANIKQIYFVTMTVEEICLAIMQKAFGKETQGIIQITLIAMENLEFELHIRDNAVSFDPFSLHTRKINQEEDYDLDAMGMLVIRQKAKSFFYRQYQGFNSLVVRI